MIINDTIVQASFTIVTYDRKNIFIIQATGGQKSNQYLNGSLNVGPNHLFGINWDKESWVRLCSVCLMVMKKKQSLSGVWISLVVC